MRPYGPTWASLESHGGPSGPQVSTCTCYLFQPVHLFQPFWYLFYLFQHFSTFFVHLFAPVHRKCVVRSGLGSGGSWGIRSWGVICWAIFGQLLDNFRATLGQLLDNFWTTVGQLSGNFWATFGQLLGNFRATFGQLLDNFRATCTCTCTCICTCTFKKS